MEKILYNFLKNTYNYKKLKETRLKKKLTLVEVSEKTKIPVATIQRYEDGGTLKIPKEAFLKLCNCYGEKEETFITFSSLNLFKNLSTVILLSLQGNDINELNLSEDYYKELGVKKEFLKNLKSLSQKEKKDFTKFLKLIEIVWDLQKEEIKNQEFQDLLLTAFLFLKLKSKGDESYGI